MRKRHGQADRRKHKDDRRPGGEPRQQVRGTARAEGRLRTLATKGTGNVRGFALLQQHNAHQEEADNHMKDDKKRDEHGMVLQEPH